LAEVFLVNPLATINRQHVHFLRDWCGGELPGPVVYPPLDLAYVAALLQQNNISVSLIDANALHIPHKTIVEMITKQRPKFVGIPSAWGSIKDDLLLAKMIKERYPAVKIIISGPNVTVDPAIALDSGSVDYVILGELEKPFLEIIKGRVIRNLAYKINNEVVVTDRDLLEDLDSLPFPARDLLPNKRYRAPFTARNPFTLMNTSRGCPYKCNFCQVNIWYMNKIRFRSLDNVIEEIDEIVNKIKLREIIFRDQTLTINKQRVLLLCQRIIDKKYDISWRCFSCVDTVDSELLKMMKKAGCHQVSYGLESGSQTVLDSSDKGITLEQIRNAVKLTKQAGIEVSGAFMFGMHGDTTETIKDTLNFALDLDLDFAQFQVASPVPTTKFYEYCNNKNDPCYVHSGPLRWYGWSKTNSMDSLMQNKVKEAYRRFYFRKQFIYKQLKTMRNPGRFVLQIKTALDFLGALSRKVNTSQN
jgi:radical SAM superfamily enzyme YgiQ (UPF0313 family)